MQSKSNGTTRTRRTTITSAQHAHTITRRGVPAWYHLIAKAGVLGALKRQAWPEGAPGAWPEAFRESRRWCFLTLRPGAEPVRAVVEPFLWT